VGLEEGGVGLGVDNCIYAIEDDTAGRRGARQRFLEGSTQLGLTYFFFLKKKMQRKRMLSLKSPAIIE